MRTLVLTMLALLFIPSLTYGDLTLTAGEGVDLSSAGAGQDVTIDCEDASSTNKGVATFDTTNFAVSSGNVTVKDDGIILGTETTGNYAAGDAEAGAATSGDSATAFFSSGTIEHEYGGLEADVSGYTDGLYGQASGVTTDIDTIAEIETAIGGSTNILVETEIDASSELANIMDDETGTAGNLVFSDTPTIATPNLTGTTTAVSINASNTVTGSVVDVVYIDNSSGSAVTVRDALSINSLYTFPNSSPTDDYILKWDAGGGALQWEQDSGAAGGGTTTARISLPLYSAKISGALVTDGDATQGASIDSGVGNWRLLFDDTTDEAAVWQFRMPPNYASGLTAKIGYTMASGTSNKVEFEVGVMAVTDGDSADIGTASFDTLNVGSATVPGTAGYLDEISITLSNADNATTGDLVFFYLSTDSDDGTNDNATGDREVVYFDITYTASSLTANQRIDLPLYSTKPTGAFVTAPAAIDAGDGNWRLLFDASSTESALWQFRMPANYASALTAKLGYTMASATSNKVDLEVEVMAVSDGDSADINTASFAAVNEVSGGTTVPGTAGYPDEISITLANADNVAAGDLVYIRVNRDHDDSDDTATGDLELVYLQLTYTGT